MTSCFRKIFPDLTWRDLQHLVVRSARPKGLLQAKDWSTNGAGLYFSHSYGFGLMDAGKLVTLAKNWKNVPEHANCTTKPEVPTPDTATIPPQSEQPYEIDASECKDVEFLEHVLLHIELSSLARRGDLSVHLLSPAGTLSTLLDKRPNDQVITYINIVSFHTQNKTITNL
jgi:furin